MKHTGTRLTLSGVAMGFCLATQAAQPPTPPTATAQATFSGIKVGIDPRTGRLRPLTAEESSKLDTLLTQGRRPVYSPAVGRAFQRPVDEAAARATARPTVGGGTAVKLPESQMSTVTLRRDAQGQPVIEHADADADSTPAGGLSHE